MDNMQQIYDALKDLLIIERTGAQLNNTGWIARALYI